ncbi:PepSY domain-containing protein [Roseibium alexandrii]|uniref:Peptidase propeptide and YPEB domain protein n=1 Tax=Roseibium alexandrii (strain DSM 17067 / NCIMB 14079 / DFL-11) TaxID=244592 RepID=A0A5E8H075_ROSAD|nr:PepSY domain-containing protein [Roseibium alexandrii]EEE45316.1 Peptidase propeptide and YPEB domain protein [Roseibium alexandrii DFL-11]
MNMKIIAGTVVAGMVLATGAVGAVAAQTATSPTALTEAQAIEIALKEVPGTVQETEFEREDGKEIFEVEIVTADGVEMEVEIDAASGTILEIEQDDDYDDDDDYKKGGNKRAG